MEEMQIKLFVNDRYLVWPDSFFVFLDSPLLYFSIPSLLYFSILTILVSFHLSLYERRIVMICKETVLFVYPPMIHAAHTFEPKWNFSTSNNFKWHNFRVLKLFLTDLWSSISLISDTGSLKYTVRGWPSAEGGMLTTRSQFGIHIKLKKNVEMCRLVSNNPTSVNFISTVAVADS